MRRVYSYRCATCGSSAEIIWQSDRVPSNEEIPLSIPCGWHGCVETKWRTRPLKLNGKEVGTAHMAHNGDLILDINPDLLTPQERDALRPDLDHLSIRLPERLNNG